uniref:SHSP domain-containing protein n=1 Tax=Megaselia scalaris TaxID=36166 RepID=T1GJQ3_MEGSC
MATLPFLLRLATELHDPYDIHLPYDDDFAFGLHPRHLQIEPRLFRAAAPRNQLVDATNELSVKVVDDCVVVEGKHEEREDEHGYISRQFVRRYTLPKGFDPNHVVSTLSSDGVLSVRVPQPKKLESNNERHVEIQQVGPAHLNVKGNENESGEKNGASNGASAVEKGDK